MKLYAKFIRFVGYDENKNEVHLQIQHRAVFDSKRFDEPTTNLTELITESVKQNI